MARKPEVVDHYGAHYRNFTAGVYGEARREAFGEDIGQNSWLTIDELERFGSRLELRASARLLDVACGSGGPALQLAQLTGCEVVGVELYEEAVANGNRLARDAGLQAQANFVQADASRPLPFERDSFDAILCIAKHAQAVRQVEGDEAFEGRQRFFDIVATLARERRLSRFVYVAEQPT